VPGGTLSIVRRTTHVFDDDDDDDEKNDKNRPCVTLFRENERFPLKSVSGRRKNQPWAPNGTHSDNRTTDDDQFNVTIRVQQFLACRVSPRYPTLLLYHRPYVFGLSNTLRCDFSSFFFFSHRERVREPH